MLPIHPRWPLWCLRLQGNPIYWGSESGTYGEANRDTIEDAVGATDFQIADLDGDGLQDIVVANGEAGLGGFATISYVYYGAPDGYRADNRIELPAVAASEAGIKDLDGDGFLDIVFASHYAENDGDPENSQIYWGSAAGYAAGTVTELPTHHAAGLTIVGIAPR